MLMRIVRTAALSGLMGWSGVPVWAAEAPKLLHQRMIEAHPAPALNDLAGREYKFLLDPAQLPKEGGAAFVEVWKRLAAAAMKVGASATSPKEGKSLKVETAIKEYLDTPAQELWQRGYVLRMTTKAKKGDGNRAITVKAIHGDPRQTLATPLVVLGAEAKVEAEGNVGLGRDGRLGEYVEKGATWQVRLDQLGALTLGDFGRFMPELLNLGLPPGTRLVRTRVYAVQAKLGQLVLPEAGPLPVSMEAWSRTEGGEIFLLDLSYRTAGDYYRNAAAHQAAEKFLAEVACRDLPGLAWPESGRWGGSKVRVLLNRPGPE